MSSSGRVTAGSMKPERRAPRHERPRACTRALRRRPRRLRRRPGSRRSGLPRAAPLPGPGRISGPRFSRRARRRLALHQSLERREAAVRTPARVGRAAAGRRCLGAAAGSLASGGLRGRQVPARIFPMASAKTARCSSPAWPTRAARPRSCCAEDWARWRPARATPSWHSTPPSWTTARLIPDPRRRRRR